jgi:hypothetical protein
LNRKIAQLQAGFFLLGAKILIFEQVVNLELVWLRKQYVLGQLMHEVQLLLLQGF